jgi:hypothetical protein
MEVNTYWKESEGGGRGAPSAHTERAEVAQIQNTILNRDNAFEFSRNFDVPDVVWGMHTEEKLQVLEKYLAAYQKVLKNTGLSTVLSANALMRSLKLYASIASC